MTAPKKPRTATLKPMPAADLTANQLRAARHMAAMDDETQQAMLRMMEAMAERRERSARPSLRLVSGGSR